MVCVNVEFVNCGMCYVSNCFGLVGFGLLLLQGINDIMCCKVGVLCTLRKICCFVLGEFYHAEILLS